MTEYRIGTSNIEGDQGSAVSNFLKTADRLLRESAQGETPLGRVDISVSDRSLPIKLVGEYLPTEDGTTSTLSSAGIEEVDDAGEASPLFEVKRDPDTEIFRVASGDDIQAVLPYVKEMEANLARRHGQANIVGDTDDLIRSRGELRLFCNYTEAAALLHVTRRTILNYVNSRKLESYRSAFSSRTRYIRRADIEHMKQEMKNAKRTGSPTTPSTPNPSTVVERITHKKEPGSLKTKETVGKPLRRPVLDKDDQLTVDVFNEYVRVQGTPNLDRIGKKFNMSAKEVSRRISLVLDDREGRLDDYIIKY